MRTDAEIIARIKERSQHDPLGFETSDLLSFLSAEAVWPFLKEGVDLTEWTPQPQDRETMLKMMHEYMEFAWKKANDGRGISAMRSMHHYMAWTWLLGDDLGNLLDYQYYGKDNLVKICKHYGWDHTKWDDGVRRNE